MNKKFFLAVPFAVALAVTGCSSSGGGSVSSTASSPAAASSTSAAASSSSSAASESATASASATTSSTAAANGDSIGGYTAAELEAIVTKLSKGKTGAVVMNEKKLAANAETSEELVKSMKITPSTCADLQAITGLADRLKQVNVASYQSADQSTGESSGVTLTSYPDEATLNADLSKFGDMGSECKSYKLEMQGVAVEAEVSPLTVTSKAETTKALQQDLVIFDQKVSTFLAQASKGTVLISATTTAADDAEGAEKLAALVDAAVAELK